MNLSIIIPTINEEANVGRAIDSACACGAGEVIIVDGGSTDSTIAVASRRNSRVICSQAGRGTQLNEGAELASGDVLLFLHADSCLTRQAGTQIERALAEPTVHGGAFRQRIEARGSLYRALEFGNSLRAKWLGIPYGDQGIFIRTQTFRDLGGFPSTALFEDVILMNKLRKLAWPVLLDGPIHVSARRWQDRGVVAQTLRNWSLITAFQFGVSPERLARYYQPHQVNQAEGADHPLKRASSGARS